MNKTVKVVTKDKKLAIKFTGNNIIELEKADEKADENSRWYFENLEAKYIYFITDKAGKITSFNILTTVKLLKEKII